MHHPAPNPAAQPHLSLNAFNAPSVRREESNGGGERPSFEGTLARSLALRLGRISAAETRESDSVQGESAVSYPAFCSVTASGLNRRPAARRRSALATPPFQGLGSSQNKFESVRQMRRSNFFRAPPRKRSLALGSRAHFAY
jgi:hypothetical protein